MNPKQVALYARVSSTQQADAGTIESQLSALRARIAADSFVLPREREFVDDGYSGSSFLRPGLERLRDTLHTGDIDRLYVLAPDRLARKYAYQVVLLEEFQAAGVEVVFLHRPASQSAEDELLLQVQGMLAEYERAKILERTRRGKRHAASNGRVNVLSGAPYGYRYVSKHDGGGQARYEVIPEEGRVVRQVFEWVAQERATIEEVCRRLEHAGTLTRTGKTVWNRSTIGEMLNNPAYTGHAPFGRTRLGEPRLRLRPLRGRTGLPKRPCSILPTPAEEWILIAVPAIVPAEWFAAVQEQLNQTTEDWHSGSDSGISASATFPIWSCFPCAVFYCYLPYRSPASVHAGAIASSSLWSPVEPSHFAVAASRLFAHSHCRLLVLLPLQCLPPLDRWAQRHSALDLTRAPAPVLVGSCADRRSSAQTRLAAG